MQLESKVEGETLVVQVFTGRLDASLASEFKTEMISLLEGAPQRLLLDLKEVEFIDSSGLGSIVSVLKNLKGEGELVICNVSDAVMSLFRLTRMDRVFRIFSTYDEAMKSL